MMKLEAKAQQILEHNIKEKERQEQILREKQLKAVRDLVEQTEEEGPYEAKEGMIKIIFRFSDGKKISHEFSCEDKIEVTRLKEQKLICL